MIRTVLLVFAALCSVAIGTSTTNGIAFDPRLLLQVQMEDGMSRFFVDFSLKMRNAVQTMTAANLYSQVLSLEFQERRKDLEEDADGDNDFNLENDSFLEIKRTSSSFEEDKTHHTLFGEGEESDRKQSQLLTHAAHELFFATKLKYYQTVLKSREVQGNFWMDRYVQLQVLSAGAAANPQMLQFLYIKMYRTNLETLRLALTFQYLAHFVSWLEDELDVHSVLSTQNSYAQIVAQDQGDDLIRDKLWAFSTYHSAASLELQEFYLDIYLSYAFNTLQPSLVQAPSAASGSAFLEEELELNATPSESQFFGGMAGAQSPMIYMTYFKIYYLMIQYSGSRAALTSVYAEKLAYEKKSGEQAQKYRQFAQNMFAGEFAHSLLMGANIKYTTTIWEWYMMIVAAYGQQQQPAQQAQTTQTTQTQTNP